MTAVERCYKYCEEVESGKILTNKWVKLAVKRFRSDLTKSKKKDYPYYFDEGSANRFCQFVELLKQYKDKFAGQPLILENWQCFIFCNIYGWLYKDTKQRRFRKAFVFVARKNGKSTLMSATLLWDLLATSGAEAYAAATKRDQARILYDSVKQMVLQNDILKNKLRIYNSTSRIINERKAGKLEALSADSDTMDGLNPSCVVIDELSAQKNFNTIKILQSGQGSRPSPLLFEITSGSDDLTSAGKQEFDRSCQILQNVFEDDSYFCILYTLDEKDDWKNSNVWIKANPNLGVSVNMDFLKKTCLEAQQQPSLESEFRCKNLGQWLTNSKAWISAKAWDKCISNAKKYKFNIREPYFAVVAVDLSKRLDLTAMTLVLFQGGKYFLEHKLYFPEESLTERIKSENELWRKWVEQGYITAIPGSTINYAYLFKDIEGWNKRYTLSEVLFDPYNSCSLINELQENYNLVEVPQNIKNLSPMSKSFEEEVLKGNVVCDHPVMRWAVNNATIWQDPNGNIKVQKIDERKENRRIDCVITSLMGIGRIKTLNDAGEIDTRSIDQIREDTERLLSNINY